MPNHVTHRVIVTGPQEEIERFRQTCIAVARDEGDDEEENPPRRFDFNTLIPMPGILEGSVSGSEASLGYEILTGRPQPQMFSFLRTSCLSYPWVQALGIETMEELRAWAEKERPHVLAAGQRAIDAELETGHCSWYEWSIEHWGTKWNSYAFEELGASPERYEFRFDTAWSTPTPIWDALAEGFPRLTFRVYGFDEGWNFAVEGEIHDGAADIASVEATQELYLNTYGVEPEPDEYEDQDEE